MRFIILIILVSFLFCGSFSAQDFIFKKDNIYFGDKELTKNSNFRKVFGKPDRTESNDRYEEFYYDDLQFSYLVRNNGEIHFTFCSPNDHDYTFFKNGIYLNELKIDQNTHLYKVLRVENFVPNELDGGDNNCYLKFKANTYWIEIMYEPNYHIFLFKAYL
ncbi:hypothetical protein OAL39_01105 [bacterium]|nr:hypothetical protein [bacterium]